MMQNLRLLSLDSPSSNPRPVLFLDRDGVLIKDCHYLSNPKDVVLLEGALELLKAAKASGWATVVITNQSGISRGLFDWVAYEAVTNRLIELIGNVYQGSLLFMNRFKGRFKLSI